MSSRRDHVTVSDLLDERGVGLLELRLAAGHSGLSNRILNPRLQKPGLALAGHLPYLREGRVQVIGESESEYLATLSAKTSTERIESLVSRRPPLIVVAKGLDDIVTKFAASCEQHAVPLTLTVASTSETIARLSSALEFLLAEREVRHGDLLDIFAIGVLILGDSGSGKSECALELIHRGHRLVADDVVQVARVRQDELIGSAPDEVRGLMEVRGLGLISIEQLFGAVAVRDSKPVDLIVRLVHDSTRPIERLGLGLSTEDILGVPRPVIAIPVAPGRSLALLVECAARKHLLSQRGVPDAAQEYLASHDRRLAEP